MNSEAIANAHKVLQHWSKLGPFDVEHVPVGLLNQTYRVKGSSGAYILQQLSPIFAPVVNNDIDALTIHLQSKNMLTPRMIESDAGALWAMLDERCWRLQTMVEGDTYNEIKSAKMAASAGALVGKFHRALVDFGHRYQFSRPSAHDTHRFLERLTQALVDHRSHVNFDEIAPLAAQFLQEGKGYGDYSRMPRRHSHGDLKISNILFDKDLNAQCLIDFDTIGLLPWPVEMGDAFRSWCNQSGEDVDEVVFDQAIFTAALRGYTQVAKHLWTQEEKDALVVGIKNIPLELAVRFLLDALEESYFGWDSSRFASSSLHNLTRAKGQWALYQDIVKKQKILSHLIHEAFA
jgi:Ser/Thr protein kinase RdoA (MazF antagonist)